MNEVQIRKAMGEIVRTLRQNAYMTQKELSTATSIPRLSIVQIEAGTRPIKALELIPLAKVFNVGYDALFPSNMHEFNLKQRLYNLTD